MPNVSNRRWKELALAYADFIWWLRERKGIPMELSQKIMELEEQLGVRSWPRVRDLSPAS